MEKRRRLRSQDRREARSSALEGNGDSCGYLQSDEIDRDSFHLMEVT